MEQLAGFPFCTLTFDGDGALVRPADADDLMAAVAANPAPTDVILLAHGFRNSAGDATDLYKRFLTTFAVNRQRPEFAQSLGARRFLVAGVFWPSKSFKEAGDTSEGGAQGLGASEDEEKRRLRERLKDLEDREARPDQKPRIREAAALLDKVEHDEAAQDRFVKLVLSLLDKTNLGGEEGFDKIANTPGSELLKKLDAPIILPAPSADPQGGGVGLPDVFGGGSNGEAAGFREFFGSIFGRIGTVLNLTTWYLMKSRSGTVGVGLAAVVTRLRQQAPNVRVHLTGHSLGGRLMASCASQLATIGAPKVHSLTLLEAAFSHYGFSPKNVFKAPGAFRNVIDKQIVTGPMIATYSKGDTTVGLVYAVASRLSGDNAQAIGDANDPYGGIGRNGAQLTLESTSGDLHRAGAAYKFIAGKVFCLDGSQGLIKNHSDVTNADVTYAFTSVVAAT